MKSGKVKMTQSLLFRDLLVAVFLGFLQAFNFRSSEKVDLPVSLLCDFWRSLRHHSRSDSILQIA